MDNATKLEILELAYNKQSEKFSKTQRTINGIENRENISELDEVFLTSLKKKQKKEFNLLKEIGDYLSIYYSIKNFIGFAIFHVSVECEEGEFTGKTFVTFEEADEYVTKSEDAGYTYIIKGIDKFGKFVDIVVED